MSAGVRGRFPAREQEETSRGFIRMSTDEIKEKPTKSVQVREYP
jgi:hypothetical protein